MVAASDGFSIEGKLRTEKGIPLSEVEIILNGSDSKTKTDDQGLFYFGGLKKGGDFIVKPTKADMASSGVTTLDLLLMAQHILGTRPLHSPYALIAADVNMSGSVTTMDIVLLRRLILNFDDRFPHGKTWRFIDAGTRFGDPMNPWKTSFNESRSMLNLQSSVRDVDFIALKIGDINYSASAFSGSRELSTRSMERPLSWLVFPSMELQAGTEVEIPVLLNTPVEGCQFALFIDPEKLEILELVYGKAGAQHVNTHQLAEGR